MGARGLGAGRVHAAERGHPPVRGGLLSRPGGHGACRRRDRARRRARRFHRLRGGLHEHAPGVVLVSSRVTPGARGAAMRHALLAGLAATVLAAPALLRGGAPDGGGPPPPRPLVPVPRPPRRASSAPPGRYRFTGLPAGPVT